MATLVEIRAKLRASEDAKANRGKSVGDGLTFPFWDKSAAVGSTSVIRFLPDGNQDNTYFWRERQVIKLEFPGVKGGEENKPVTIQVPCMKAWGETCPILTEINPWFNAGPDQEALARKYWVKRTYMFQGFVRESAVTEEKLPVNPIRKFVIGPQLFGIVKSALLDVEMESLPIDYLNGIDFRLTKDEKGGFSDYTRSSWSRRETPLVESELLAIEKYGLADLGIYLPEKPTPEAVAVIFEMFEASLAGDLYDPERWAKYYKPYGLESNAGTATTATTSSPAAKTPSVKAQPVAESVVAVEDVPASVVKEEVTASASAAKPTQTAQDILARLRAR